MATRDDRDPVALANLANVVAINDFLMKKGLEAWMAENADTPYLDMLMAVHNFHKQVVDDLARRWWEEQHLPPKATYAMARDTFMRAMNERIVHGLPPETITEEHQDNE